MKITTFDKTNLKVIRGLMQAKLDATELNVKFTVGSCRFDAKTATFKVELAVVDETGRAATKEGDALRAQLGLLDLTADDLAKVLHISGADYSLEGVRKAGTKFPFTIVRLSDGARLKATASTVYRALGKKAPDWMLSVAEQVRQARRS